MGRSAKLKAERKALRQTPEFQKLVHQKAEKSINKGMASYEKTFIADNVEVILAAVVLTFGAGKVRLDRFMNNYDMMTTNLQEFYEFDHLKDIVPECRKIVERTGFSLDKWQEEHGSLGVDKYES